MSSLPIGPPSSPLVLSYKGILPDHELIAWASDGLIGGVVLFRDNCTDEAALCDAIAVLRGASPDRLYIMVDEEGGRVRRLSDAPGSMADLRSYEPRSPDDIAELYAAVARRLRSLGIDTLLAPVVDIGDEGADWLNSRTLSHDRARVAEMARAVIPAIQRQGVHACAKHFPGTGRVVLDPHQGPVTCPIKLEEWSSHERIPFEAAISAGVDMILVGHQIMEGFGETLPACLAPAIPKYLLKQRLGCRGLILTDDLGMGAIARTMPIEAAIDAALSAECDLVLVCNDRDLQKRAVAHWMENRAKA